MMVAIGLIKRRPEVDMRRAVHVKLLPDTHAALRILCIKKGISMQEFIEEMAQRAISSDPKIEKILEEFVVAKREKYYRKLTETDAESLYDIFEIESPLKNTKR